MISSIEPITRTPPKTKNRINPVVLLIEVFGYSMTLNRVKKPIIRRITPTIRRQEKRKTPNEDFLKLVSLPILNKLSFFLKIFKSDETF